MFLVPGRNMMMEPMSYPRVAQQDYAAIAHAMEVSISNTVARKINCADCNRLFAEYFPQCPYCFRQNPNYRSIGKQGAIYQKAQEFTREYYYEDIVGILPIRIHPVIPNPDSSSNILLERYNRKLILTETRFIIVEVDYDGSVSRIIKTKDWIKSGLLVMKHWKAYPEDHVFQLKCDDFKFSIYIDKNWYSNVPRFISAFLPILTNLLNRMIYFPSRIQYILPKKYHKMLYDICYFPEAGYSQNQFCILNPNFQKIQPQHRNALMAANNFLPVAMPVNNTYEHCVFFSTNVEGDVLVDSISRVHDSKIVSRSNDSVLLQR